MRRYRIRKKDDKFYLEYGFAKMFGSGVTGGYIDDHRYSFEKQIDKWDTNVFDTIEEAREAIKHKPRLINQRVKEAREYLSRVEGVIVT